MSYDIVVRFPDKKMADEFCGQMSDGFGEGLCDFDFHKQKEGTDGTKNSHYEKITTDTVSARATNAPAAAAAKRRLSPGDLLQPLQVLERNWLINYHRFFRNPILSFPERV